MSSTTQAQAIPGHYIVVFKSEVADENCEAHCSRINGRHESHVSALGVSSEYAGIKYNYKFANGFRGYAGNFHDDIKAEIEASDEVEMVEPDYKVFTQETTPSTKSGNFIDSEALSWGLARISHKAKLTSATKKTYRYEESAGQGVRAYIIDTGILANHKDFEGRAKFGHNAVPGSSNTDKNGHGTHVSGTIGGKTYGVAKKATLIGVKVLGDNGSGSNSGVIAGLQWAAQDAADHGALKKSVANMSLGGAFSTALNRAVAAVVAQGMTFCVAAGNDGEDANGSSPASEPTAITVGATTVDDKLSPFSNYGKLVDIFAPGSDITSTWIDESGSNSTTKTKTISGTSMATPHVTGLAACLISAEGITGGAAAVEKRLKQLAGVGLISGLKGGSVNLLAYNGAEGVNSGKEE